MTDLIITTADKLACAKRELAMRKNAHEITVMAEIVADYEDALIKESVA